jgi:NTP pyrophosphatase (non-canonical NTP hydrolase)
MTFDDYQKSAANTAIYNLEYAVMYPALGLCGEAGEVAEKIKKLYRDRGGLVTSDYRELLAKELGDVLWYVAALCRDLNVKMEDVAQMNLNKLADRQARGKLQGSGDTR